MIEEILFYRDLYRGIRSEVYDWKYMRGCVKRLRGELGIEGLYNGHVCLDHEKRSYWYECILLGW